MRLLFGQDAAVANWVACRIPKLEAVVPTLPFGEVFGPMTAIGVVDGAGHLRGGVVYHNLHPIFGSIELSCASEGRRWLTRPILRALLNYPFGQLKLARCTSVTPRKSGEPREFLERLGFKREGVLRRGFGDDHAVVYGLLREEWDRHPYNQKPAPARNGAAADGEAYPDTAARA
jgi:hypothetical protein